MSSSASKVFAFTASMLVAAALESAAAADRSRDVMAVSVRDCTRVNGRFGYYGNPWCSPAEQLRFDRAEARRRQRMR